MVELILPEQKALLDVGFRLFVQIFWHSLRSARDLIRYTEGVKFGKEWNNLTLILFYHAHHHDVQVDADNIPSSCSRYSPRYVNFS